MKRLLLTIAILVFAGLYFLRRQEQQGTGRDFAKPELSKSESEAPEVKKKSVEAVPVEADSSATVLSSPNDEASEENEIPAQIEAPPSTDATAETQTNDEPPAERPDIRSTFRALQAMEMKTCEGGTTGWNVSSPFPEDYVVRIGADLSDLSVMESTVARPRFFGEIFSCQPNPPDWRAGRELRLRLELSGFALASEGQVIFRAYDSEWNVVIESKKPIPAGSFDFRRLALFLPFHPAAKYVFYSLRLRSPGKVSVRQVSLGLRRNRL